MLLLCFFGSWLYSRGIACALACIRSFVALAVKRKKKFTLCLTCFMFSMNQVVNSKWTTKRDKQHENEWYLMCNTNIVETPKYVKMYDSVKPSQCLYWSLALLFESFFFQAKSDSLSTQIFCIHNKGKKMNKICKRNQTRAREKWKTHT